MLFHIFVLYFNELGTDEVELKSSYQQLIFLPMRSKRCNTDGKSAWTSRRTVLDNKPHLVIIHESFLINQWTFRPIRVISLSLQIYISSLPFWLSRDLCYAPRSNWFHLIDTNFSVFTGKIFCVNSKNYLVIELFSVWPEILFFLFIFTKTTTDTGRTI